MWTTDSSRHSTRPYRTSWQVSISHYTRIWTLLYPLYIHEAFVCEKCEKHRSLCLWVNLCAWPHKRKRADALRTNVNRSTQTETQEKRTKGIHVYKCVCVYIDIVINSSVYRRTICVVHKMDGFFGHHVASRINT